MRSTFPCNLTSIYPTAWNSLLRNGPLEPLQIHCSAPISASTSARILVDVRRLGRTSLGQGDKDLLVSTFEEESSLRWAATSKHGNLERKLQNTLFLLSTNSPPLTRLVTIRGRVTLEKSQSRDWQPVVLEKAEVSAK